MCVPHIKDSTALNRPGEVLFSRLVVLTFQQLRSMVPMPSIKPRLLDLLESSLPSFRFRKLSNCPVSSSTTASICRIEYRMIGSMYSGPPNRLVMCLTLTRRCSCRWDRPIFVAKTIPCLTTVFLGRELEHAGPKGLTRCFLGNQHMSAGPWI